MVAEPLLTSADVNSNFEYRGDTLYSDRPREGAEEVLIVDWHRAVRAQLAEASAVESIRSSVRQTFTRRDDHAFVHGWYWHRDDGHED